MANMSYQIINLMDMKRLATILTVTLLFFSCGTDSTSDISFGPGGQQAIIPSGLLEATVDTEVWPGEITSVEFTADGAREIVTVSASRSDVESIGGDDEEVMVIRIFSEEGSLLMEGDYSGENIEITLDEADANLPDERWKSSSGTVQIVELSEFNLQVRFNAAMRLKKDLDQGITDGDLIFIEDGRFNESLRETETPTEERVTLGSD